jgi:DNA-binding NtrC family response regulator
MAPRIRILLIDDVWGRPGDPQMASRYGSLPYDFLLESAGESAGCHSVESALRRVVSESAHLGAVLLDIMFGASAPRLGLEILAAIRLQYPTLPVVMFTTLETEDNREVAVRCLEMGANDYLEKSAPAELLHQTLQLYVDSTRDDSLLGNSAGIRQLRAQIARVAFSGETSVLVVGESGTGKELVARAIHRHGPRRRGPFVAMNSAHADSPLTESLLFGHERGSFTGATEPRRGLIEEADGGVLFLDEIADMPIALQAKLLRVLETRTFRRIGGARDVSSQFQLVCATNRRPEDLLGRGLLREDFFYRIATMILHVPPLRARRDDVPMLAQWLLLRFKGRSERKLPATRLTSAAAVQRVASATVRER